MALSLWNDDFFLRPFDMPLTSLSRSSKNLTKDFMPLMGTDLIESDTDFHVHVDLPGVNPEDLEVTIQDKFLCLKAERKYVHEENTDKVHSMERSFGTVQRKIRIPNNADMDQVATVMKNGVLTITMPKKPMKEDSGIRKLQVNMEK